MTAHREIPALPFAALGIGFLIGGAAAGDVLQLQLGGFWIGVALLTLLMWEIIQRHTVDGSPSAIAAQASSEPDAPGDPG